MFVAMVFHQDTYNKHLSTVRALRDGRPFQSKEHAIRAIEKQGHEGYVKQLGIGTPIWHNVGCLTK